MWGQSNCFQVDCFLLYCLLVILGTYSKVTILSHGKLTAVGLDAGAGNVRHPKIEGWVV